MDNDKVQCAICGRWFGSITPQHLKTHSITMNEYREKYPDSEIQSNRVRLLNSEKNKGANNHNHNPKIDQFVAENTNKHLCACGCGEYIVIRRAHYHAGIPRFIKDHSIRSDEIRDKVRYSVEKTVQSPEWRKNQSYRMIEYYKEHPEKIAKGWTHTDEAKQKNRDAHLGKKHSEETKRKRARALKGRIVSEATRKKISSSLMNHAVPIESRKKISASHQGIPYDKWEGFVEDNWRDWHNVTYLNEPFPGCHRHHLTRTLVACIPAELHNHIRHNLKTGYGMAEINMLALQFCDGDVL